MEKDSPIIGLVALDIEKSGGVKTVAEFIFRAICEFSGYRVKIISLASSASDANSSRLSSCKTWLSCPKVTISQWSGIECFHVGANWSEFEFQRYRPRRVLSELISDCDLIQVVAGSPAVALSCVGLGKPVLLQVATRAIVERRMRASNDKGLAAIWRRAMTKITDRLDEKAIRDVDYVMVENPWMLEYCTAIGHQSSTSVIFAPPGVDINMFSPVMSGRKLGGRAGYILSVGRWDDPRKNVNFLLEAYRLVVMGHSDVPDLVLVGSTGPSGDFWEKVVRYSLRHRVRFIEKPSWPDLITLYQGATCFALSSDEEGFGMVVIEAMACGVPVVATRCGGPEGIIDHDDDGLLSPLEDVDAFAASLQNLCFDLEKNRIMGMRARIKVENKFSLAVAGQRFIDVYDNLLKN